MKHDDVDELVESYKTILACILDKHAPLKRCKITIHPDAQWVTDSIKEAMHEKRKAECKWKQTELVIHKDIYTDFRNKQNNFISTARKISSSNELKRHQTVRVLSLLV